MYLRTMLSNASNMEHLREVVVHLSTFSIPFILLNGACLVGTVYPGEVLREMNDLGILVHRSDLPQVKAVLLGDGWEIDRSLWKSETPVAASDDYCPYTLIKAGSVLDLYVDVQPVAAYCVSVDGYWSRAQMFDFMGTPVRRLCTADLLQYLCIQVFNDLLSVTARLKSFVDVAELLKRQGHRINWELLLETSIASNCLIPVEGILGLCQRYFRAPVHPRFQPSGKRTPEVDFERLFTGVFHDHRAQMAGYAASQRKKYILDSRFAVVGRIPGLMNKMRYIWYDLFPSKEFMTNRYAIRGGGHFWYYPYRLFISSFR